MVMHALARADPVARKRQISRWPSPSVWLRKTAASLTWYARPVGGAKARGARGAPWRARARGERALREEQIVLNAERACRECVEGRRRWWGGAVSSAAWMCVGKCSEAYYLERNSAMDDSIGGS